MECENDAAVFDLYESCHICTYRNLSLARNDEVYAKRISKEVIDTAWDSLPLADQYLGMLGMTPQEFLHVTGCGLYKHELISIRDIVGPKDSNAKVKDKIDKCFSDIKFALEHNSERDISRMSNRKGFFNHASLTSEEVRGNFFGMVVMMHTSYGESLFRPAFEKKGLTSKRPDLRVYCYWHGNVSTWTLKRDRTLRLPTRQRNVYSRESFN